MPSPQAVFHRLSSSVVAPTNSVASLTACVASEKRSAADCTDVPVEIAACSRLAWNGSRPWPVEVVPFRKYGHGLAARKAAAMTWMTRSASRLRSRSR